MLSPEPKNQRGHSHENAGYAKCPTVTRFMADQWNDKKPEGRAEVDGPIEPAVNFRQGAFLIRTELITDECRHTWFDAARADGDQRQSGLQSSTASFKECERAVTEAVEKRDAENRPVTAKPTIGEPAADEWQKIDSRREQVQHLGSSIFSHSHPVQQIQFQDPDHPVIAEPFARLIADDEFDLRRKPASLVRRLCRFRGGGGFGLHRGILLHYHVSCNSDTACRGSFNRTTAFPLSTRTVSAAPIAAS